MAFRIGQKVICVKKDAWTSADLGEAVPEFNSIYTIRTIDVADGCTFFRFNEIRNRPLPYVEGVYECFFYSAHFRPIVERETDISALQALLVPGANIREPA
ncbi:MAG: hypothetical protein JWL86_625 [Rhizobium sp.]|nr:hypothetical protein [Rhizobium sp.]